MRALLRPHSEAEESQKSDLIYTPHEDTDFCLDKIDGQEI